MADRPILFSAPMIRAILAGRKTQTRRIITPCADSRIKPGDILVSWPADQFLRKGERFRPRFAKGDRLWVREAWRSELRNDQIKPSALRIGVPVYYEAGGGGEEATPACAGRLRPGMFMPRWASRLTLTVTDVWVERLQEISEADCLAEGAHVAAARGFDHGQTFVHRNPKETGQTMTPRAWYHELWDTINDPGSWDANPWICAVSFEVERRNIDAPQGE